MTRRLITAACIATALGALASFALPALASESQAATLRHIDASGFTLSPSPAGIDYGSMVDKVEKDPRIVKTTLDKVVTADAPARTGRAGLCHPTNLKSELKPAGFCWDADDDTSADWTPQGITGSGDADPSGEVGGRRLIAASWHFTDNTFARISIADVSDASAAPRYHHLLLVQPTADGNFTGVDNVHADGLMWFGDRLFVATGGRLQVFSTEHIWQTGTSGDDAGKVGLVGDGAYARWHGWAMPMIAEYRTGWGAGGSWKSCASVEGDDPCMNSISLAPDRTSFVTAEYYQPGAAGGRVIRWGIDAATGLPSGKATEAFASPIWHQQGIATDGTYFYITGDCPGTPPPDDPNNWVCVHRAAPDGEPHVFTQGPPLTQNLSYWPQTKQLWGINERINTTEGKRVVFNIHVLADLLGAQPLAAQVSALELSLPVSTDWLVEGLGEGSAGPARPSHGTVNRLARVMATVTASTMKGNRRSRRAVRASYRSSSRTSATRSSNSERSSGMTTLPHSSGRPGM
ncbi:MAG TPA: hypothetical protein VE172_20510 [Stackebrandtia sp.]|uniref:hypothetical protein n=1 Tax=Stackebrandtia sp. TaxID=2023065 RepID=UPI002D2E0CAA|nr:hypothetical protein [Stackebrandtia sp.]HZE41189.1 hypothetical protein [Stackebrandtia sp.]